MSEIPYMAIDELVGDLRISQDDHFHGTGQLVVPFTMLDISGEQHYSWLGENGHAFASWLPLYDNYYWIFVCKGDLLFDKDVEKPDKINLYGQGQTLTEPGEFEFYYTQVAKPFRVDKITDSRTVMPFTYASRQARTGAIPGVTISDYRDQNTIMAIDDQNGHFMDDSQTDDLIRLNAGEMLGVDGL